MCSPRNEWLRSAADPAPPEDARYRKRRVPTVQREVDIEPSAILEEVDRRNDELQRLEEGRGTMQHRKD